MATLDRLAWWIRHRLPCLILGCRVVPYNYGATGLLPPDTSFWACRRCGAGYDPIGGNSSYQEIDGPIWGRWRWRRRTG